MKTIENSKESLQSHICPVLAMVFQRAVRPKAGRAEAAAPAHRATALEGRREGPQQWASPQNARHDWSSYAGGRNNMRATTSKRVLQGFYCFDWAVAALLGGQSDKQSFGGNALFVSTPPA